MPPLSHTLLTPFSLALLIPPLSTPPRSTPPELPPRSTPFLFRLQGGWDEAAAVAADEEPESGSGEEERLAGLRGALRESLRYPPIDHPRDGAAVIASTEASRGEASRGEAPHGEAPRGKGPRALRELQQLATSSEFHNGSLGNGTGAAKHDGGGGALAPSQRSTSRHDASRGLRPRGGKVSYREMEGGRPASPPRPLMVGDLVEVEAEKSDGENPPSSYPNLRHPYATPYLPYNPTTPP